MPFTDHLHIILAPVLPPIALEILVSLALLITAYALFHRAHGSLWRGLLFALLLLALANPSLVQEQREPLKDTALLVIDDSASMQLGDRAAQSAKATEAIAKKLADFPDLNIETLHVKGSTETDLFHAIEQKLADIPHDRFAGVIAITDGEIHDKPEGVSTPGPFHALLAGHKDETDRRIAVTQAPAYGIAGKNITLTVRISDEPKPLSESAPVTFRRDDGGTETINVPVGKDVKFDTPINHVGQNLFVFSTDALPNELTPTNNTTAVTVNGIRDRLRVLLISSEPHIGTRTWRNFLKADPAVDLVHFTILRSPMKQDSVPNNELALIAFPVNELFNVKLNSFDLIIFDRFQPRSLIADTYLENIARYVEHGGALLVSSITDEENNVPLAFSPLARVLPAQPTGRLLTGGFVPMLTTTGQRHPVTDTLNSETYAAAQGRWFRQIESKADKGDVLMTGLNNQPLLVLNHVGDGRVAQFLSDQFWLWSRNYEGGGPVAELLRRTAHWLVGEPDLDENALRAHAELADNGWQLVITKQSLKDDSATITLTDPQDRSTQVALQPGKQPGILGATQPVTQTGLYHVKDKDSETLVMVGPTNAPEFGAMRATEETLSPIASATGGGISWLEDHPSGPDIRRTAANGAQSGWGWIGLKKNDQYKITGSKAWPLWPAWAMLALLLAVAMWMWRREGKA